MSKINKKILIIEDEAPMAQALELKFSHAGFGVTRASNGKEGLVLLEKEMFDLILLDIIMPKLDGFQVLEILNKNDNKIPVMVLTNLGHETDESRAKTLGAKEFFIKTNTPIATIVERAAEYLK